VKDSNSTPRLCGTRSPSWRLIAACVLLFSGVAGLSKPSAAVRADGLPGNGPIVPTVVASGLDDPRGLTVGPDGNLYGGIAGSGTATNPGGECGAAAHGGAATGGGVVRIAGSEVTTVSRNLPSTLGRFGQVGAAAVAFIGNTMYVLEEGTCSGSAPKQPKGVYRVGAAGSVTLVANLTKYYSTHPVKTPDPGDFAPAGNPFSMMAMSGDLYVAEANHAEIDKVDPTNGTITRLLDFSQEPWLGITGIASWQGSVYFADLTEFPVVPGTAGIFKLNADGSTTQVASGLTAVAGLAIGADGTMYATELTTAAGMPKHGNGAVVSASQSGVVTTLTTDLYFPSGITVAPDGGLDVSDYSDQTAPETGEILHLAVPGAAAVRLQRIGNGTTVSFTVSFVSAHPGDGWVEFGSGPGCSGLVELATQDRVTGTTSHTVTVTGNDLPGTVGDIGIEPGVSYWFETVTVTQFGAEVDDNDGRCYSLTIPTS